MKLRQQAQEWKLLWERQQAQKLVVE